MGTKQGFMIAGVTSGVGKTTITMGLIQALRRRGLRVQPFKAGPDYIDPSYHALAAGVPSRNLDTWMVPHAHVQELFHHAMQRKDIAVVEGVMGLYDGRSATTEEGSGAELAKLLGLPVILVVDASKVARSAAATVLGFLKFDPAVRLAGVILNQVAAPRHADICTQAIQAATGLPVLGAVARRDRLRLPERHLGLIPTVEGATAASVFQAIADEVGAAVDLDRLMAVGRLGPSPQPSPNSGTRGRGGGRDDALRSLGAPKPLFPQAPMPRTARVAVAMDRAFNFYYQDSLDLLAAWGAEIIPFSPLEHSGLPEKSTGVYIGGGFPETYARELAANRAMAAALQDAATAGMPVYAECGGLMYLGRCLVDFDGVSHTMAGLLPITSTLVDTRLTLGYRTIEARADGPALCQSQRVRGHEFHWSRLETPSEPVCPAYSVVDQGGRPEGVQQGSVLASYVHLHLAADTRLAPRLVQQFSTGRRAP